MFGPFDPLAISAGLLTNLSYDILKHRVQPLDGTRTGKMLKWAGIIEPSFEERLRDTLTCTLELYFKKYPKYELTGIETFLRDPVVARQIGNYILDGKLPNQEEIHQAIDRHLGRDAVAKVLMQRRGILPERIIPDFFKCYLYWLLRASVQNQARRSGERSTLPACKHRRVGVESDVVDSILMLNNDTLI